MKIAGIVAEYNPFHAGHAHHLARTRAALGEDAALVAVMSGSFVQRGDCAILDKWTRARAAAEGGADLVLELPTVWAAASAERFAWGAVSILRAAGAEVLSFGSESGDGPSLRKLAACLEGEAFREALRRFLDAGLPFAACRQRAAEAAAGPETAALLSRPNDNLGVEYLKAAARLGWNPKVIAVPRMGADHDGGDHPVYPSASWLRERMLSGQLPADNPASLRYAERAVLARLRSMSPEDFARLPDSGEGLDRRLYAAARRGTTLAEVYDLAKTKRYAHSRIRRMALWAFLGLTAADVPESPPYLRVLALNGRGRAVLRRIKGASSLPVITKPARGRGIPLLELEARCTDLYGLCRRTPAPCGAEWTTGPAVVE